jgi:hypothetical protein
MKKAFFLILFCFTSILLAQTNNNVENNSADVFGKVGNSATSYGSPSATFFNPARRVEGSVYLFDKWTNQGVIYTSDSQKFSLKNINLNIERSTFESKISEDSIFTFNFNNIDRILINNRAFKNYYYDGTNRIFEVIYDSGKLVLLKGYKIQLVKGSPNPMLNRSTDRNVQKEFYFVMQNNLIKPFRLKKKSILGLMSSEQAKVADNYAKEYRLSYSEDEDIKRILTQGFSN